MTLRRLGFLSFCLLMIAALTGLGVWQVQRLMWKNHLIADRR